MDVRWNNLHKKLNNVFQDNNYDLFDYVILPYSEKYKYPKLYLFDGLHLQSCLQTFHSGYCKVATSCDAICTGIGPIVVVGW